MNIFVNVFGKQGLRTTRIKARGDLYSQPARKILTSDWLAALESLTGLFKKKTLALYSCTRTFPLFRMM